MQRNEYGLNIITRSACISSERGRTVGKHHYDEQRRRFYKCDRECVCACACDICAFTRAYTKRAAHAVLNVCERSTTKQWIGASLRVDFVSCAARDTILPHSDRIVYVAVRSAKLHRRPPASPRMCNTSRQDRT